MTLPAPLARELDAIGVRSPRPEPQAATNAAPWKPTHKGEQPPF